MPSASKTYFVYILAGKSGVLYIGVTNSLIRRIAQHKEKKLPGFTEKYGVTKLVWFELFGTPSAAIRREKEIKSWRRSKKIALIEAKNPAWHDLSPN